MPGAILLMLCRCVVALAVLRGWGVQYVHCVMHKCIMVKLGGKRENKVCKNM